MAYCFRKWNCYLNESCVRASEAINSASVLTIVPTVRFKLRNSAISKEKINKSMEPVFYSEDDLLSDTQKTENVNLLECYVLSVGKYVARFWRTVVPPSLSGLSNLPVFELLDPEDECTAIFRNFGKYLPVDIAWNLRRLESSATPLWEPHISPSANSPLFLVTRILITFFSRNGLCNLLIHINPVLIFTHFHTPLVIQFNIILPGPR